MQVAIDARVSTTHQTQAQTIAQQIIRLNTYVAQQGWTLDERHVYRDDGSSGASLHRPGLDRLRDHVARAEVAAVVITAPDRLARKYSHQVLRIEELEQQGSQVWCRDRPLRQDPHDHLRLQIRGAVADYARTLISDRLRRGRVMNIRAGQVLPWSRPPFGSQVDPERPRDPAGVRLDAGAAVVVPQIFAWYRAPQATLDSVAQRLIELQIRTPAGKPRWSQMRVRNILRNPAYTGTADVNRFQSVPAQTRKSALFPLGRGAKRAQRPRAAWIAIPVPALVTQEAFDQVQEQLIRNQQGATRNNPRYEYLLRALVSCGVCKLNTTCRTIPHGYHS